MNDMEYKRFDSGRSSILHGTQYLFYEVPFCFSSIDPENKSTAECRYCVAIILALTSASSGEELSMIGHISPEVVTVEKTRQQFCTEYPKVLLNAKHQAKPGSMAMHLVGGRQGKEHGGDRDFTKEYIEMIKLIGTLTTEQLGITLQVKSGPKTSGVTDVAFGTENRIVVISEPKPDEHAWEPFDSRSIDTVEQMYS